MLLIRCSMNTKLNLARFNNLRTLNLQRTSSSFQNNENCKEYWRKNEIELKRPTSPFVMYKPQITTVLSLTHRTTGIVLSGALYSLGISQLLINDSWANQLTGLYGICPNVYLAAKLALVGSFYYHLFNGVRHLAWDLGKGYELKQLYATGYLVLLLSVIATVVTMSRL